MDRNTYIQPSCKVIRLQLEHIVATSFYPDLEEVHVDETPYIDLWD